MRYRALEALDAVARDAGKRADALRRLELTLGNPGV
jgi:hypothetical protein